MTDDAVARAELDAYNAAFAIPEIALGVLVASGLSAPFVPIFLALRGEQEQAANAFASTVLTLAILIIGVAIPVLFVLAPQTVEIILGTLLLTPSIGIFGPAVGAILGAAAHLAVRLLGLRGSGIRFRPALRIRTRAFR